MVSHAHPASNPKVSGIFSSSVNCRYVKLKLDLSLRAEMLKVELRSDLKSYGVFTSEQTASIFCDREESTLPAAQNKPLSVCLIE
jgi:hypothetical protein